MKKIILNYTIIFLIIILFSACTTKTTSIHNKSIEQNQGIVIGTFSRESNETEFFKDYSFKVHDLNNNHVKTIFKMGKENIFNLKNPYSFDDDYKYNTTKGSFFSFSLPKGKYSLNSFEAGQHTTAYGSNYFRNIEINEKEILYIGDIKFKPSQINSKNLLNKKVAKGANVVISDRYTQDKSKLEKQFLTHTIINDVIEDSFPLTLQIQNRKVVHQNDDIYKEPKMKKEMNTFKKMLLAESLIIFNSYIASQYPNEFGLFMGLMTPIFAFPHDENNNPDWLTLARLGVIPLYNISIDKNNYSKKKVFVNNMILWHINYLIEYYINDSKNDVNVQYEQDTIKVAYNHKFEGL
jgi:hypothetical protein